MEDNRQEDLDLISVIRSIGKGISNFFKALGSLVEFSIKHMLVLGIFIVAFGAVSLGLYLSKKPYYSSDMSVSHIRFENEYCIEMIRSLNMSINESNGNAALARKLQLKPEYAQQVRNLQYKPMSEQVAKRYADSVRVLLPFKIEVEVYSNDILDTLQAKLISYLENNEYTLARKSLDQQALAKSEARLNKEIENLDSLKKLIEKSVVPQATGNGIILGAPINPVLVYEAATKLYDKKLDVNKRQAQNNSFNLVVGFSENSNKVGPGKLTHVFAGGLIGYILGLLFVARRAARARKA